MASARVIAGRMVVSRRASLDLTGTGGPKLRRRKRPESQPRIHTAFDKTVILFHHTIQILALPQCARLHQRPVML
jgi:hypothetical protein